MAQPKLRFKREDGMEYPKWKTQKLSSVSSRVVRKNKGNVSDIPLTISSLYGLVDQREYFNKTIASQNMDGYYLLKNGEFAYNKSYSKGYDFGSIKRLDKYECGALSTLYICFVLKNCVDSDFMVQYFDSQKWSKEVSIRCAEGARNHGLLNISTNDFFDIEMLLPEVIEEQQKIAVFLSSVDEVITQSEAEVQNLEQQKKAAMQKIFSQEVRFRREDGTEFPEWVETTFGTYYKIISGNAFKMNDYVENGVPLINGESIQHGYINDNNMNYLPLHFLTDYSSCLLSEGDIVLGLNRPITNGQLKIAMIPSIFNNSLLYQRAGKIVFKEQIDKYFTYIFLNKQILDFTLKEAVGSDQPFISTTKLEKWKMIMPSDKQEIKQIGMFFKEVDEAISYAKQELDKWKELKKGLLQQMFV